MGFGVYELKKLILV